MFIKNSLLCLTTAMLFSSATAQDGGALGSEGAGRDVVFDGKPDNNPIPTNDTPVAGMRSRGLAVPESTALVSFFRRNNAELLARLPTQDAFRLNSAMVAFKTTRSPVAEMENLCRRAIELYETEYTEADVLVIGEALAAADAVEKQVALDLYSQVLNNVSAESAAEIRAQKEKMHSSLNAFETDWVDQSRNEPEWLLTNFSKNCDRNE